MIPFDTSWLTSVNLYYALKDPAIIAICVILVLCCVDYLLYAPGLYRIANKRGIVCAPLAFIPFVNAYALGKVCGEIKCGKLKIKSTGKWLIALPLTSCVFGVMAALAYLSSFTIMMFGTYLYGVTFTAAILLTVMSAICLAASKMLRWITYYALYSRYCDGMTSALLLVLSIIFFFVKGIAVFNLSGKPDKNGGENLDESSDEDSGEIKIIQI